MFLKLLLATAVIAFASGCPQIYSRSQWFARPPKEFVNMSMPLSNVVVHHTVMSTHSSIFLLIHVVLIDNKAITITVMGDGECETVADCMRVMREIQDFHMDGNGWADIGYSFLIGAEGSVFEGRGWNRVGAHAPGMNDKSVGISLIGNYMTKLPPQVQMNVTKDLIQCGIELGHLRSEYDLYGHRDVTNTDCPGDVFYEELSTWPHKQTK